MVEHGAQLLSSMAGCLLFNRGIGLSQAAVRPLPSRELELSALEWSTRLRMGRRRPPDSTAGRDLSGEVDTAQLL